MSIAIAPGRLTSRIPPLLRETAFRRYWGAQSVSMAGDEISSIALPLAAVLALHASPAEMGYLSALIWLPSLLFALHAGAWVDRRGHRRVTMIAADLGRAALLASIPVCAALGVLTLAQLFAVAFAAGTLSIFFTVSDAGLFVALVPGARYVEGNALIYQSRALAAVAGPAWAGCWCRPCPRRSPWPLTRCRSSARRSSWAASARTSPPRPGTRAGAG